MFKTPISNAALILIAVIFLACCGANMYLGGSPAWWMVFAPTIYLILELFCNFLE